MTATYYSIYEFNAQSQVRGEIVDEGIITNSEDTIYPGQNTGIAELPYECDAHHFKVPGYGIEIYDFYITREMVLQNKTHRR